MKETMNLNSHQRPNINNTEHYSTNVISICFASNDLSLLCFAFNVCNFNIYCANNVYYALCLHHRRTTCHMFFK